MPDRSQIVAERKLPFDADQEAYMDWYIAMLQRVQETSNDLMYVDLNDGVMMFLTARKLAVKHPEKLDLFREHTPEAVSRAMDDLGMFMGSAFLAEKVGLDAEEVREAMISVLK